MLSRSGEIVDKLEISGRVGQFAISPDQSQLSYTLYENADSDVWVWDFDQQVAGRRTFDGDSSRAHWSFDSSTMVFNVISETQDLGGIWAVPSDGSSQALSLIHISEPTRPY